MKLKEKTAPVAQPKRNLWAFSPEKAALVARPKKKHWVFSKKIGKYAKTAARLLLPPSLHPQDHRVAIEQHPHRIADRKQQPGEGD